MARLPPAPAVHQRNPTAAPSQFETLAPTSESRPNARNCLVVPTRHDGHADDRRSTVNGIVCCRPNPRHESNRQTPSLINIKAPGSLSLSNRAVCRVFRESHVPSASHADCVFVCRPFDTVTSPTCTSTAKHHPPRKNQPRHQDANAQTLRASVAAPANHTNRAWT
jgi:hypothetical protein